MDAYPNKDGFICIKVPKAPQDYGFSDIHLVPIARTIGRLIGGAAGGAVLFAVVAAIANLFRK